MHYINFYGIRADAVIVEVNRHFHNEMASYVKLYPGSKNI